MRVVMRVDASLQIGSGHVMRCLTLADELRSRGAEVHFICREHPGNLFALIAERGYPIVRLPLAEPEQIPSSGDVAHAAWLGAPWQQDAQETVAALPSGGVDWLIVDHYALDQRWEQYVRPHVGKIMVIDDLADRPHDCDLLLDQNLYPDLETRYDLLTPPSCRKLLGPKNALLRPEFIAARRTLRERDGVIRRVLVFFGGVDPTNETGKVLAALASIEDRSFFADVVVGMANPCKNEVERFCHDHDGFRYHCQIDTMAELMAGADLALGAAGSTTWERCYLGLPSITIVVAENQAEAAAVVEKTGVSWNLGWHSGVNELAVHTAIVFAQTHPQLLREMSFKGRLLMGEGNACEAVSNCLLEG